MVAFLPIKIGVCQSFLRYITLDQQVDNDMCLVQRDNLQEIIYHNIPKM